jgi:transcriptional regulator with XRE-family HTH domain
MRSKVQHDCAGCQHIKGKVQHGLKGGSVCYPFYVMKRPAKPSANGEADRLKEALRAEMASKGVSLRELAARTERSDGYWSQVFNGLVVFTVEHLFTALLAVGSEPRDFFRRYYNLPETTTRDGDSVEAAVVRTLKRYGFMPSEEADSRKE